MFIRRSRIFSLIASTTLIAFTMTPLYAQTGIWSTSSTTLKQVTGGILQGTTLQKTGIVTTTTLQTLEQLNSDKKNAGLDLVAAIKTPFETFESSLGSQNDINTFKNAMNVPDLKIKSQTYADKKAAFEAELDRVWSTQNMSTTQAKNLRDILELAALTCQNQIETDLGPQFISSIPGLPSTYEDFVVAKQSFYQAMHSIIDSDFPSMRLALEDISKLFASVGNLDRIYLDIAMNDCSEAVQSRLDQQGLGELKRDVVRNMFPVFLIACDGTKALGAKAESCQWFQKNKSDLQQGIREKGVPGEYVYVSNRSHQPIVGFPTGKISTTQNCSNVDPSLIIDSVTDPRAMGLGDCGFAGMFAACPQSLAGQQRYICPRECQASGGLEPKQTSPRTGMSGSTGSPSSTTGVTAPTQSQDELLRNRWPGLTDTDLQSMADICRPAGSFPPQGAATSATCDVPFPQEGQSYAECMTAGAQEPAPVPGTLLGAPTGSRCDLANKVPVLDPFTLVVGAVFFAGVVFGTIIATWDEEKAKVPPEPPPLVAIPGKTTPTQPTGRSVSPEEMAKVMAPTPEEVKALQEKADTAKTASDAAAKRAGAATDARKEAERAYNAARTATSNAREANTYPGKTLAEINALAEAEKAAKKALDDAKAKEAAAKAAAAEAKRKADAAQAAAKAASEAKDCFADSGCMNTCTALGSDIAKTNECMAKTLAEGMAALGRSKPGITPGEVRPPSRSAMPIPDNERLNVPQAGEPGVPCLGEGAMPVPSGVISANGACGLVHCGGPLAAGTTSGCCGGDWENQKGSILAASCNLRCSDGSPPRVLPDGSCECPPEGAMTPPTGPLPGPKPGPAGIEGGLPTTTAPAPMQIYQMKTPTTGTTAPTQLYQTKTTTTTTTITKPPTETPATMPVQQPTQQGVQQLISPSGGTLK